MTLISFEPAPHVDAQTTADGSIRGIVRDEQSAVLSGVSITATSPSVPGVYAATTDITGLYRLNNLPPGEYTVTVKQASFAPYIRDHVLVRAGLNIGLDVMLQVAQIETTVHVTADSPVLETKSATTAFNISGELQRALPTSPRRNWSDALTLTPGVISADSTIGGLTQNYLVHGSSSGSHVLQVDGVDIASSKGSQTFYVALNTDLIEDVQLKTAGVDASAPLGTGAVMNIATKSGTNTFRGAFGSTFQAKSWNSSNVPGGSAPAVTLVEPDASLGGPIAKDKLWFFGAYRRLAATTGVARTATQIRVLSQLDPSFDSFDLANRASLYFLKLTANLSPMHRLAGFYQSDLNRADSAQAQDGVPSTSEIGGRAGSVRLTSSWSGSLISELGVSYNNKTFESVPVNVSAPYKGVYRGVVLSSGRWSGTDYVGHIGAPANAWTDQPSDKATISYDVTYFRPTAFGTHEFKTGLFLQPRLHIEANVNAVNNGFGYEALVLKDPNNPAVGLTPFWRVVYPKSYQQFRSDGSDNAFYIQDLWKAQRLTATVGVRVDRIRYDDKVFNLTTQKSVDVGPRFGVNYALKADGRSVARFTWNRVHDRVAGAAYAGTISPTLTSQYDLDLNGSFETVDILPGTSTLAASRIFDPKLHQPYVNELTAGCRQQFDGQVSVDVGFIHRTMPDRFTLVETNGIYDGNVFRGYQDVTQNQIYKLTNNVWNWPVYNAFEVTATKHEKWVELIASYTRQWQHLAGTWQPNDPALFVQPAAFPNDRGIGLSSGSLTNTNEANSLSGSSQSIAGYDISPWHDHIVRAGVTANLVWGLMVASSYTYQSGPWSGPIVTRLSAPDPAFGPPTVQLSNGRVVSNPLATVVRFAYPTRSDGQFRLQALHMLNLRLSKMFEFGHRQKLALSVDAFNVTNHAADQGLISGGNVLGTANFGVGQNRQVPRGGQIGARFTF